MGQIRNLPSQINEPGQPSGPADCVWFIYIYLFKEMSHPERRGTDQERSRSFFTSLSLSFPIWKMEPSTRSCPVETGRTEVNSGEVLPTIARRRSVLVNTCVRNISVTTTAITTITVLIRAVLLYSRNCSNCFTHHTHSHHKNPAG